MGETPCAWKAERQDIFGMSSEDMLSVVSGSAGDQGLEAFFVAATAVRADGVEYTMNPQCLAHTSKSSPRQGSESSRLGYIFDCGTTSAAASCSGLNKRTHQD